MILYGCIAGKEVACDLPIEQVARLGIDPWRLDLMDPDPVIVEVCGKPIAFSRLVDVVFAYIKKSTVYLGVHDGGKAVCFYGDSRHCSHSVVLKEFKVSSRRFEDHFAEYLVEKGAENLVFSVGERTFVLDVGLHELPVPRKWYEPVPFETLEVCGGMLTYCTGDPIEEYSYKGRMYELQTFNGLQLPEAINWVHTTLAVWKPIVAGAGLIRALLGEMPNAVDFLVSSTQLDEVQQRLKACGVDFIETEECERGPDPELAFKHFGCTYTMFPKTEIKGFSANSTVASIHSCGVDQVLGARIGFADLSMKLTRDLNDVGHIDLFVEGLDDFSEAAIEDLTWSKPTRKQRS